jgi:hypothetical protein
MAVAGRSLVFSLQQLLNDFSPRSMVMNCDEGLMRVTVFVRDGETFEATVLADTKGQ